MRWSLCRSLLLITAAFCLFCGYSFSQEPNIRFLVKPGDSFQVKVDNDSIFNASKFTLTTGEHKFKIWAPTYKTVDTTLFLHEDSLLTVTVFLKHSQEWRNWDVLRKAHNKRQALIKMGPATLCVGALVYSGVQFLDYRNYHKRVEDMKYDYDLAQSADEIVFIKRNLEKELDDMLDQRSKMRISFGITAATVGILYFVSKKIKQKEYPVFSDKERVNFEGVSYVPNIGNMPQAFVVNFRIGL